MSKPITVRSHVGRDLLQSSAYFSSVPKVVWEYVSNSVDNPNGPDGVNVEVKISQELISIRDDGSGMSREDLRRFFEMHGENIQRLRGKKVRGRFGTGKCAAFGVANCLRVETVRNGLLNIVEIHRDDVSRSSGEDIPVREEAIDRPTMDRNGTTILITKLQTRQMEIPGTIAYLQRHLGRQHQRHQVIVNGHLCELEEPTAVAKKEFRAPAPIAERIGPVVAVVNVAVSPLQAEEAGIDVYSCGNWHDTTLAGVPLTDLSRRIFGEVEVAALEDYDGPFPPFDNTRSNALSPQNPLVATLFGWLGECIRQVLADLEENEAQRRRSAEARDLRAEANRLEKILNEDFEALQRELDKVRKATTRTDASTDLAGVGARSDFEEHVLPDVGGADPIDLVSAGVPPGNTRRKEQGAGLGQEPGRGGGLQPGDGPGAPHEPIERPRRSSGFTVDFRHETEASKRSRYDTESKTIVINLDHPQVEAALKLGGLGTPAFRQMAYELAAVEYSLALGYERLAADAFLSGEDVLYEVRDTVNRIAVRLAGFFK